ncbi:aminomethyltransferase beta-barrel domain-containing protein [Enterococcus faecium]|uniref:aminomethyltransferase beta-barrel domain-containing protein n=1 Tax=Enterococcus faecium TaxID=1352 RepID=UPI003F524158
MRSRDSLRPAVVRAEPDGALVELAAPALPAPGQACVFYQGTRVLGGGFIARDRHEGSPRDRPLPFG